MSRLNMQNFSKKLTGFLFKLGYVLVCINIFLALFSVATYAQNATKVSDLNILNFGCLFEEQTNCEGEALFPSLVRFGKNISSVLAVVVIMWGGYKYLFSGLVTGVEDGKRAIFAGVCGLLIVQAAGLITSIVQGSVNEQGLNSQALITNLTAFANNLLIPVSSVFALIVVVWGGYQYMFSGLPGEKQDGLKTIINGLIGLVVIQAARPIIFVVNELFLGSTDTLNVQVNPFVSFVKTILTQIAIPVSTVVTLFFLVVGGYKMITAKGNSDQYEQGMKDLQNALIGLIVVLLSTTIVQLIVFFIPTSF